MLPRLGCRPHATYLNQGEDRGGNVTQHPHWRKPTRCAQPPCKKKVTQPHEEITDAGECKNTGAHKVINTVDKPENGSSDAQNGHYGAAHDKTGRTGTI